MSAELLFTFKHVKFPLLPLLTHSGVAGGCWSKPVRDQIIAITVGTHPYLNTRPQSMGLFYTQLFSEFQKPKENKAIKSLIQQFLVLGKPAVVPLMTPCPTYFKCKM